MQHLLQVDAQMASLITRVGPCGLQPNAQKRSHFAALARAIVYQQLAGKAAGAIWRRVHALLLERGGVTPLAARALSFEEYRAVGMSRAKALSLHSLADACLSGEVPISQLWRFDNEDITRMLVRVRGIGPWTAHMFLMFQLGRLDVWPAGDFAVRNGYRVLYSLPELPTERAFVELGDPFRPYRSIAAWYLWEVVDGLAGVPVGVSVDAPVNVPVDAAASAQESGPPQGVSRPPPKSERW